ncbi:LysE family translocator [Staphylococcus pettenkoferi]|uniref:LysE family translocator n=1 Tax=Staphylococcus pettenkoferi TaxID=170573 RepID=UPI000CD32482|nr:LysE family translocator [Staphylococcus pettenkoferi]MCY1585640.1 LysE family translocator [Staphylococcus pettenkoferi]MCY1626001.1 LysE family translocator [Staphylococcus pettenkoferi]PNZ87748.1 lysine transporter LysE [Staphylococcus pettenkoferi]QQC36792.1 LysE family translocator [Staphylococcus pettenkoferi]
MNILSFVFYTFLVTGTPGPTNLDILNTIKSQGRRAGIQYTYGASLAFFTLLVLSALINSLFAQYIPPVLTIMKVIGSLYMLYLVYLLFKSHGSDEPTNKGSFKSGYLLQFLNPKVITFTLTVLPSFVLGTYHTFSTISLFIIVITLIGVFSFGLWVVFGALLQRFLQRHEMVVTIVMAIFLVYAAVIVWL